MHRTIFEKLILQNSKSNVQTGELVEVSADLVMIHDVFALNCFSKFHDMGFKRVFDPEKVVIIYDHLVPAGDIKDLSIHREIDSFAQKFGIKRVHRSDGICHQLMVEKTYAIPGQIILGTDSHSVTYGALGALSIGVGYSEMAAVLGTGTIWLKVVPSIRIDLKGKLPDWLYGKDIALNILKIMGSNGANYKAIEFGGSGLSSLSMDSRFTICNMAAEAGAKTGLIACDDVTENYLRARDVEYKGTNFTSDPEAKYDSQLLIDLDTLEPQVSFPYDVQNVGDVSDFKGIQISQAFLGSCTNGRIEDLEVASRILKGKRIARNVRLFIVPASRSIFLKAAEMGLIQDLVKAGAIVQHPSCSLCAGLAGGIVDDSDTLISSTNRNFPWPNGWKESKKLSCFSRNRCSVGARGCHR